MYSGSDVFVRLFSEVSHIAVCVLGQSQLLLAILIHTSLYCTRIYDAGYFFNVFLNSKEYGNHFSCLLFVINKTTVLSCKERKKTWRNKRSSLDDRIKVIKLVKTVSAKKKLLKNVALETAF